MLTERQDDSTVRKLQALQDIPHFTEVREPSMLALVATGRAGTKLLQSFMDDHDRILMVPAYPLMYLYPHWGTWSDLHGPGFTWERATDLFCEKHASVLDSRKIPGLGGLTALGPGRDEHIEIDEQLFRTVMATMVDGLPVRRRTFLLALHYAYAFCKGWDLESKTTLLYHLHDPTYVRELANDFPDLKVWTMVREPKASLASTFRAFGIVDKEKLNPTDSTRNAARNFRIDCHLEFQVLDEMGTFLAEDQVVALSHENLVRDQEGTMKFVSKELGFEFSPSLLQSTFDGKLWWGDVTNTTPVNGLDPNHQSDRWGESMGRMDAHIVEGITSTFFDKYGYKRTSYRKDTVLRRLLLALAILWPTRVERKMARVLLDPRTHIGFLRAAIGESTGRIPRKDYGWNATYLYKWSYLELKLWRSHWYVQFLDYAARRSVEAPSSTTRAALVGLSRTTYVAAQYARFLGTVLTYPVEIVRRWSIYYGSLSKRMRGRAFLPRTLN